jgi:hypothetical protein
VSARSRARLDELSLRIERLVLEPEAIRARWTRMIRPLLSAVGWTPRTCVDASIALLERLRELTPGVAPTDADASLLARAIAELEDNVEQVERLTVVRRQPLLRHATWLRRLHDFVEGAARAIDNPRDPLAPRLAVGRHELAVLPPLAALERKKSSDDAEVPPARAQELQLAAIDHLLVEADDVLHTLGRRRRLLEAARQVLLETAAAIDIEAAPTAARLNHIQREVTRIDRLEAAGLRAGVGLLYQAERALARDNHELLYTALVALEERAIAGGEHALATAASEALDTLGDAETFSEASRQASLTRSAVQMLSEEAVEATRRGYETAQREHGPPGLADGGFYELVRKYYVAGAERHTLACALAVDGAFEVGGVMSPVRVKELRTRYRAVRQPTQRLELVPAQGVEDLADAVISDPRSVILELAAGRLLTRRYLTAEQYEDERIEMRGEVRVYVLDGSGSMVGPRARMRDAILIAELSTLARRLSDRSNNARVVLFYCYFDTEVSELVRIDTSQRAIAHIESVAATLRTGGTNIEKALLESFAAVRRAKSHDPDLARGQIVLITDGESDIDEAKILRARASVGELDLGVSVIALGQENRVLRALVAGQRARGERAFYHFVEDETLGRLEAGRLDFGRALHLPKSRWLGAGDQVDDAALADTLRAALDEIADIERAYRRERTADDGPRCADARALKRRFNRWFPAPSDAAPQWPEAETLERDDLEAAVVLLTTITEVVELVEGTTAERQEDAVALLERMLPDAALSPARYQAALDDYPGVVASPLSALHGAVRLGIRGRLG